MKYPRNIKSFCQKCKTHTDFTVSLYKKGRDRSLAEGNRRYERKQEGYGGQRKPKQKRMAKTTKKQNLIIQCNSCGYKRQKLGIRLRKLTISA